MNQTFGWSISSLKTINQCGHLWRLKYFTDEKPEAGRDSPALAFGRAVHKAIEEIHLRGLWDLHHWVHLWDDIWLDQAADVDWEAYPGRKRNYERLGPTILASYTENDDNRLADIECLEQRFEVEIDGMKAKGVVDQIRRTSTGLLLVDFKTSKEPSHALVERTDPQLTLYAYVCNLIYGSWPTVAHYYLRTGQVVVSERREEDIELVLAMMRDAQKRVDEGLFARNLGWHCNECGYRTSCLGGFVEST